MLADAKEVSPEELTDEERSLQVFSREVLGIDLKFFQGAQELHGRYDKDGDIFYVNRNAEVSMDWVFWHEAFHAMKEHEPELYHDLLRHTEKTEMFTKEQMDGYWKTVQRPSMSDGEVMEELLADAFADSKIGRRTWQHTAEKNPTLVRRLTAYIQKILRSAQRFFRHGHEISQQGKEDYPGVRLTDKQFRDFSMRMAENLCSLCDIQGNPIFMSQGYRILAADGKKLSGNSTKLPKCRHSHFQYAPQKQKSFDQRAVRELLQHYTQESVQKALSALSPLGQQTVQYGKRMVQEVGHNER